MLALPTPIPAEDHVAIQQLLATYAWALDTADLDTLRALFLADGILQDTRGNRYEGIEAILAYCAELTSGPEFRGRRHHIDNLLLEPTPEGYLCRSYWTVTKWDAGTGQKQIDFTGHSRDLYVRQPGGWRIRERLLYYWHSHDCPWHPASSSQ